MVSLLFSLSIDSTAWFPVFSRLLTLPGLSPLRPSNYSATSTFLTLFRTGGDCSLG